MRRLMAAVVILAACGASAGVAAPASAPATRPADDAIRWVQRAAAEAAGTDDPRLLARLALAQAGAGDVTSARASLAAAEQLAAQVPDAYRQCEAFLAVAGGYARAGQVEAYRRCIAAAMRYPERAADAATRATVLDFIAHEQAVVNDAAGWRATIAGIADPMFRAGACIGVGRTLLVGRDPAQYVEAANLAEQAIAEVNNPATASLLLHNLSALHAQARDFARAAAVAQRIADPTWRGMAHLAIAGQRLAGGDSPGAAAAMAQAKAIPVEQMTWGKTSFLVSLAGMEAAGGNGGGVTQALEAARRLADAQPNSRRKAAALVEIAAMQLRLGQKDAAVETVKAAEAARATTVPTQPVQLDPLPTAYGALAAAYAVAGDLPAAQATANAIAPADMRHLAYGSIVQELAAANRCEQAASFLPQVGQGFGRRQAILAIAAAFARCGKLEALGPWIDSLPLPQERAEAAIEAALTLAPPPRVAIPSTQPATRPAAPAP